MNGKIARNAREMISNRYEAEKHNETLSKVVPALQSNPALSGDTAFQRIISDAKERFADLDQRISAFCKVYVEAGVRKTVGYAALRSELGVQRAVTRELVKLHRSQSRAQRTAVVRSGEVVALVTALRGNEAQSAVEVQNA